MFLYLEQLLISYASQIHLAIFSPAVSFIEEVIPPIPSPSVMLATGSMAQIQGYTLYGLLILALLGALGKTVGALIPFFVADKVEDIFSGKIAKFIGVTHEQIESFGRRLGKGWVDYFMLIFFRAMPVVPSSLLSVGCGLVKVPTKLFIITTFLGSILRDFFYIYLGYIGTTVALSFVKRTSTAESLIQIVVVVFAVIALGYMYYRRKKMLQ